MPYKNKRRGSGRTHKISIRAAKIELAAHAKVNLFLKVLNKRKDSYHNILTLFERISLCDKIKISKISKDIALSSNIPITRSPKDNLAYRAAELILHKKKLKGGVRIEIKKNIPIGAGLGGGSSDAAAVLIGINRLFNLRLARDKLLKLAGHLGADVPFFVLDTAFAFGRSRGERLKIINYDQTLWHLLVYPGFELSTKAVYEAFDRSASVGPNRAFALTRGEGGVRIPFPLRRPIDFDAMESMLYNDLEEIAKSKKGIISNIIESLAHILGKKAILSGSGPSLFCLYRTRKEAIEGKRKLLSVVPARERIGWRVFVVGTMD